MIQVVVCVLCDATAKSAREQARVVARMSLCRAGLPWKVVFMLCAATDIVASAAWGHCE